MRKEWLLCIFFLSALSIAWWKVVLVADVPATQASKNSTQEPSAKDLIEGNSPAVVENVPAVSIPIPAFATTFIDEPQFVPRATDLSSLKDTKDYLLAAALTTQEQTWMRERGYPNSNERLGMLPDQELLQLAEKGDLTASYHWMMKKIDQGLQDAHGAPPLRKSVFVYRLRAAFELGLIGPGWLNGGFEYKGPRNLVNGIAMDTIAQRLGEESLLPILTAESVQRGEVPPIISLTDLGKAQELADREFRLAIRFGLLEGSQLRLGERRRLSGAQRAP